MQDHDSTYRKLFSHPRMVEDLITGYVQEDWIEDLDFSTLQQVETSFVDDKNQRREADVIWKVQFRGQWLYLYLLLEFQSRSDRLMALRMLVYVSLLYQNLLRQDELDETAPPPPVLPIVIYNGNPQWHAAQSMAQLHARITETLSAAAGLSAD